MRISYEERAPVAINSRNTAPTPSGFAQIVSEKRARRRGSCRRKMTATLAFLAFEPDEREALHQLSSRRLSALRCRLYDRLIAHFGEDQVFIDIDQIEPGEDFVEVINRKVGACDIAIIAIGPNWLRATDASGKRRLDDEEDFVRMEIVAALQRKIRVIPVLVGGAEMPHKHDLPEALVSLSRRNAIELSETRFHADVNRLIEAIDKSLAITEEKVELSTTPVAPRAESASVRRLEAKDIPSLGASIPATAGLKEPQGWTRKRLIIAGTIGTIVILVLALAGFLMGHDHQKAAELANQPAIANPEGLYKPPEPKSTDQGDAAAQSRFGIQYQDGHDVTPAVANARDAVQAGVSKLTSPFAGAAPSPAHVAKANFTNSLGCTMVWIASLGMWVAETEVTQREFQSLMNMNPSDRVGSNLPVDSVTFREAVEFCNRLQKQDATAGLLPSGYGYTLPTDEQWDVYCSNATLEDSITSQNTTRKGPQSVKSKQPNEYGLYDTRGNVWEWTKTPYDPSLNSPRIRAEFPFGVVQSGSRQGKTKGLDPNGLVLRGGSWRSKGDLLKKTTRGSNEPGLRDNTNGFRVVLAPAE